MTRMAHGLAPTAAAAVVFLAAWLLSAEPFGVNGHTPMPRVVGEIAAAGIRWVRIDLVWPFVEPEQDRFDWRVYDALVADLESRGLRIYATVQSTPAWATDGEPFAGVPRNPDRWREVCFRAAARYRGRIHAWGFWNEPNSRRFWHGSREQYVADILRAGAESVRAADPGVLVCGPDLAHLRSANWDSWLRNVVSATRTELDVVTHHLYPSGNDHRSVTRALTRPPSWPWEDPSVRQVLDAAGWSQTLPFWLTETGASSSRGEASQAGFYRGLLADWFGPARAHSWMSRVFFYHIHDDPDVPQETFGLLTPPPGLRRKEAYAAYRDFVSVAEVDDAEVLQASLPAFVTPGAETTARVVLRNSGTTLWGQHDVTLRVLGEPDGWTQRGGGLPSSVAEGAEVAVAVTLVPPADLAGLELQEFVIRLRLERPGYWWFGDAVRRVVTVTNEQPPVVLVQPAPVTMWAGANASFTVLGSSPSSPVTYRWRRNGMRLDDGEAHHGTDQPTLRVLAVDGRTAGTYDCVLANAAGEVTSAMAQLRVVSGEEPDPRRSDGRFLVEPQLWWEWHQFVREARGGSLTDR